MLRNPQQRSLLAQPVGKRNGIGEEFSLRNGGDTRQIAELASSYFGSCAPAPSPIYHRAQLYASRDAPQIQIARGSVAEERAAQIPILVARIEINLQAKCRILEQRRRQRPKGPTLFRIPAQQRSEVNRPVSQIVNFG